MPTMLMQRPLTRTKVSLLGLLFCVLIALVMLLSSGCTSGEGGAASASDGSGGGVVQLLNASYDPTRELYDAYNPLFAERWQDSTGQSVNIRMSHGGSGKQTRSIIDGLAADVATLAVAADVNALAERGLVAEDWDTQFPSNSSPYTTVQVLLVRKGNPKNIQGWKDLARSDVDVITPNPKTSGGARWNFLAAWGYALRANDGSEQAARQFVRQLYQNVPVLDSGARGATTTFVERGIGDVLITYENEAFLAQNELGENQFEIVVPNRTILVEPPVAVVSENASGPAAKVARAYLQGLYTTEAQEIAAEHYYRPRSEDVLAQYSDRYPDVNTFTVGELYGSWPEAQERFFDDGGIFDQIYAPAS